MRAVVFVGKNEVQFKDLPDPKPGPDDVVVNVTASGICHTDYEVLRDHNELATNTGPTRDVS